MNTNLVTRPTAGRAAVGAALVFALAASFAAPAHAQNVEVSAAINLPGSTAIEFYYPAPTNLGPNYSDPNFAETYLNPSNNPTFPGVFDFTNAVSNNLLPTTIGVVSVSLQAYELDTAVGYPLNGNLDLVLSGTTAANVSTPSLTTSGGGDTVAGGVTVAGSSEILNTGITLDGFLDAYTNGNFSYSTSGAEGSNILDLLNDTGGTITAGIYDQDPGVDDPFNLLGGQMSLTFSVPFSPMQWLGIGLIVLMAGVRLSYAGGLKQLRVLVGV
jgi:hypothetical protein